MKEETSNNSRRKFLKSVGITVGAAGVVSGFSLLGAAKAAAQEPGETVNLLTQDGQLVQVDKNQLRPTVTGPLTELQKRGREGIAGKSFVMVIDLSKCRNARKCMAACQNHHQLRPDQHHINVLQMQDAEHTAPYFMPKPCQHCDNPPCTKVCPVDATFKRQDGIVLIDNERCIGCRFCIAACPYSARIFQWTEPKDAEKYKNLTYNIEANVPQKKGTVSKCLFSADRLRENKLPSCVSSCPNGVYYFGDQNEDAVTNGTTHETVRFSQLIKENAGYTLMPELGTKPRVYYLPPKNRAFEFNGDLLNEENLH
ncbi:4Fe-4S dicluster domain-containing protein [Labilibaculum sp. A4]|uniref:4Fe-4S dicluster domain-containing protein n=1 Tax=Labilibaculum euxinus TaxID=2686357 RepID=UPI000F617964|nr:4Fe-4S dicluster domain-containing protein [Labilibaculum euxinus]MDQ1769802.1 4Fe-4S dicluster domain-containing protein [Labilibaculum euxinus]MWN76360.1 4Fe-4S dicluster domain-containing protein [Labilibaculum euxinus]